MHLSGDSSLFQSPSATARAFMATGKEECLACLKSLVGTCGAGVPPTYLMDEELKRHSDPSLPIEHELSLPWIVRLNHLEHRTWIEEDDMNVLWAGKTSFHRLSSLKNEKFVKLAVAEYEFRQSIYKNEMAELKSWCLKWDLSDMGFGREKTMYCYFASCASLSLPYDSYIRMTVAKGGILITVEDDFFDMEGSLNELNILTDAVRRWDAKGLSGHGKWFETFASRLLEAKWSKSGYLPSMDEYLRTGMTSIAARTLVLPASCLLKSSLSISKISRAAEYETVTKLVMLISRLSNDIQSYQKEIEDGKMNSVLLYMKENPDADIDDSIAFVRVTRQKEERVAQTCSDGWIQ
ncbi:hypothetical protein CRYUN_Cryun31cG0025600 [Craigia yunnanensis]